MSDDLRQFSTADLQQLHKQVSSGALDCPLTSEGLSAQDLQKFVGKLGLLNGLGKQAVLAVLSSVLAERMAVGAPPQLVWTGPEVEAGTVRDTEIVVSQLFASTKSNVLVAGYSFDHGEDILQPLHAAMKDRGVTVELYLHLPRISRRSDSLESHVALMVKQFLLQNWPFGDPKPEIYYDPRTVAYRSIVSLHAKCIIVDERKVFLGSANFTDRGQTRNIEVGLVIEDPTLAKQLKHQWRHAVKTGQLKRGS